MKLYHYYLSALAVIAIDQAVKLAVHNYMLYGMAGEIQVLGNWFKLHYTLNPGMAFGFQLGGDYGKTILTFFRIAAMFGIGYLLKELFTRNYHKGLVFCTAMVLGGAVGNLVDSVFYGVFLNNAPDGSPGAWFHGQVIDMFYIDLWQGYLPEWLPIFGGQWYAFWPIFNVADAAIFCSLATVILYQKRFLPDNPASKESADS